MGGTRGHADTTRAARARLQQRMVAWDAASAYDGWRLRSEGRLRVCSTAGESEPVRASACQPLGDVSGRTKEDVFVNGRDDSMVASIPAAVS
eukprot:SAG11_NODE_3110_length_2680_cov_1.724138_3_plen_92_part_00